MIVPYGLSIGLLKCNKWHLTKNFGSLGWIVCGFQFDPSLDVTMVWPKKMVFGGLFRQLIEEAAPFPKRLYEGLKKKIAFKMFVNLPSLLYFDQGRRSCPMASCLRAYTFKTPLQRRPMIHLIVS